MYTTWKKISLFLTILFGLSLCQASFQDDFAGKEITGWNYFTGDGDAQMNVVQKDGFARISVDATQDKHNVWWAIIKRDVSNTLDMAKLEKPGYELRVQAKI